VQGSKTPQPEGSDPCQEGEESPPVPAGSDSEMQQSCLQHPDLRIHETDPTPAQPAQAGVSSLASGQISQQGAPSSIERSPRDDTHCGTDTLEVVVEGSEPSSPGRSPSIPESPSGETQPGSRLVPEVQGRPMTDPRRHPDGGLAHDRGAGNGGGDGGTDGGGSCSSLRVEETEGGGCQPNGVSNPPSTAAAASTFPRGPVVEMAVGKRSLSGADGVEPGSRRAFPRTMADQGEKVHREEVAQPGFEPGTHCSSSDGTTPCTSQQSSAAKQGHQGSQPPPISLNHNPGRQHREQPRSPGPAEVESASTSPAQSVEAAAQHERSVQGRASRALPGRSPSAAAERDQSRSVAGEAPEGPRGRRGSRSLAFRERLMAEALGAASMRGPGLVGTRSRNQGGNARHGRALGRRMLATSPSSRRRAISASSAPQRPGNVWQQPHIDRPLQVC
jgi:hypothetical protein